MGDYFDWWIGGGTWYDRRQQEQIASLSATHARSSSRLRRELREESRRSQDLATRLGKLEEAVIASIELEDLRGVMENFSDAVATRRYARDVLARIPALGRVPSSQRPDVPPDVPDYWLHPAVRSVEAAMSGDAATERTAADEARRRDPVRTAQFLAAVAILRRTEVADDDLATLWPTSRQVSRYQRSLWLAVAEGGLGEEARTSLVQALRWALGRAPEAAPEQEDAMRLIRVTSSAATYHETPLQDLVLSALLGRRWPTDPASAGEALEHLREGVEQSLAEPPASEVADEVPDGVADLLAKVVSAGAPAEEPLVTRIVELRQAIAAIGATTEIATPGLLDEESLDVLELLRADLAEGTSPGARVVAAQVLREPIEKLAARLAEKAAEPLPDEAKIRAAGVSVNLTSLGPIETDWRAQVTARLQEQAPGPGPALGKIVGGGAVAVLGVALAIIFSPGWYVLALAGAGLAGYGYLELRRGRAELERRTTTALADADAAISAKSAELAGQIALARGRQAAAPDEVARIAAAFPAED